MARTNFKWTPEADDRLRTMAANGEQTRREMGRAMGISFYSCTERMRKLGIKLHGGGPRRGKGNTWTTADLAIVRELDHLPAAIIAARLGRSPRAIFDKRMELGLTNRNRNKGPRGKEFAEKMRVILQTRHGSLPHDERLERMAQLTERVAFLRRWQRKAA